MYTVSKFDIERRKIQKIRLLRENLQSCHSLAPSTLSIALTVKLTLYYVTQVHKSRAHGRAEKQYRYQVSNFLRGRERRKTSRKCPF